MVLRRCPRRLTVLLLLILCGLTVPAARPRPARAAQTTCAPGVTLINGDFESPAIAANSMSLINEGPDMPGWKTTAPDHVFELWHEVRQGFNAATGVQFVELNANYVSTLYQDVATTPGQTLRWELRHRGRLGTDVMAVRIGPAGGALVQQGSTLSDVATAWGTWSMNYTVPAGQTTTRFAFESVSAAQNKPTYGNFLDGISFGTAACLLTTTSVSAATANVGDVLTYTVNADNRGGNPAKFSVLSDTLPAGTTFVPGSIRSITGSASTAISDNADGDTGEYDSVARTVRVRAGTGATAASGGRGRERAVDRRAERPGAEHRGGAADHVRRIEQQRRGRRAATLAVRPAVLHGQRPDPAERRRGRRPDHLRLHRDQQRQRADGQHRGRRHQR
ncbi:MULTISPECIES: DUF11 domain-containing protein [unclassified Actinoplanes]|uniref:DUF11 domain-containing protein n=1 Tax=unclassified Actinoplanes TaxID=2626549 RepID=UPI0012BABCFC|nr:MULTISPECIES: DUF11 domain-containing protein [unclassified Actinoplanes]